MRTGRLSLVEPNEAVSVRERDKRKRREPMSTNVQIKTRVWNSDRVRLERPVKETRNQKSSHMHIS